jgi:hypothetical protein
MCSKHKSGIKVFKKSCDGKIWKLRTKNFKEKIQNRQLKSWTNLNKKFLNKFHKKITESFETQKFEKIKREG